MAQTNLKDLFDHLYYFVQIYIIVQVYSEMIDHHATTEVTGHRILPVIPHVHD